jgi:hypothetical protein
MLNIDSNYRCREKSRRKKEQPGPRKYRQNSKTFPSANHEKLTEEKRRNNYNGSSDLGTLTSPSTGRWCDLLYDP